MFKICPQCQTQHPVDALACNVCGHVFRTKFHNPLNQTQAFFSGQAQSPHPHFAQNQPFPPPAPFSHSPHQQYNSGHPLLVFFLCLCIGGWVGNIVNGQTLKGIAMLVLSVVFAVFTGGLGLIITYPLTFIDAMIGANKVARGHVLQEWEFF